MVNDQLARRPYSAAMLRIFSVVYGEKFCDLFERIALRSLMQPLNAMVASAAHWSIYTMEQDAARLRAMVPGAEITTFIATDKTTGEQVASVPAGTAIAHGCLLHEIRRCLAEQATMIMAPPDTFWGDGSLVNLVAVAGDNNLNCIAAPHPRVNREDFLAALPDGPIGNAELVRLSLAHLHRSWREADAARLDTNTFFTGTSIQALPTSNHYAVRHRLPTCYLARFTEDDFKFFNGKLPVEGGPWDHWWPALLVRQERHRCIGSSDAFFVAELTAADAGVPPTVAQVEGQSDRYCRGELHNQVNRNFVSIWRAA
jgi:hypothetical protein